MVFFVAAGTDQDTEVMMMVIVDHLQKGSIWFNHMSALKFQEGKANIPMLSQKLVTHRCRAFTYKEAQFVRCLKVASTLPVSTL